MLKETTVAGKPVQKGSTQPQVRASHNQKTGNVLENQYYASIYSKLQPHWQLPEYRAWDPGLVAIVVVRIDKNGNIVKQLFEKKSEDDVFNQFVVKALQYASPLPPIPSALGKEVIEIGLRFRPEGIQF